ncbi:D-serine dehydratase [Peribacillus simplex]|nr:D-serine dehydratase [Peribacillus simplex]
MIGPSKLCKEGIDYLQKHHLTEKMGNGTHIIWGTGGSMVPEEMMKQYYQKGLKIALEKQK